MLSIHQIASHYFCKLAVKEVCFELHFGERVGGKQFLYLGIILNMA